MGPVVADLWHDQDKDRNAPAAAGLEDSARAVVGYVVARDGQLTGRDLIHLTHAEAPWRDASESGEPNSVISEDMMASFFRLDEEAGPVMRLADAALSDPEARRFFEEAAERSRSTWAEPDDPEEIERRLEELRG